MNFIRMVLCAQLVPHRRRGVFFSIQMDQVLSDGLVHMVSFLSGWRICSFRTGMKRLKSCCEGNAF